MKERKGCPRCEKRGMKSWNELTDDEKTVVKRLPRPADLSEEERHANHRWCTRCWYEDIQPSPQHA
jgi:hypothetical protein